jgi:hypothetical protein
MWADDGYDGWAEAGWSEGRKHSVPDSTPYGEASGVGIRQEIADVYVVMRLAELVCEQRVGTVVESAVANFGGNNGCLALHRLAPALAAISSRSVRSRQPLKSETSGASLSLIKWREPGPTGFSSIERSGVAERAQSAIW